MYLCFTWQMLGIQHSASCRYLCVKYLNALPQCTCFTLQLLGMRHSASCLYLCVKYLSALPQCTCALPGRCWASSILHLVGTSVLNTSMRYLNVPVLPCSCWAYGILHLACTSVLNTSMRYLNVPVFYLAGSRHPAEPRRGDVPVPRLPHLRLQFPLRVVHCVHHRGELHRHLPPLQGSNPVHQEKGHRRCLRVDCYHAAVVHPVCCCHR